MSRFVFHSNDDHYTRNVRDGAQVHAVPATLAGPTAIEPGTAIMLDRVPVLVIPRSDALRLAHDIADAAALDLSHAGVQIDG